MVIFLIHLEVLTTFTRNLPYFLFLLRQEYEFEGKSMNNKISSEILIYDFG